MACSSITAVCLHPPTPSSSLLLVLGYGIHLRIQCEYIWWWYSHEVVVNSLRPHRLLPSRIWLFETPWTVALQATPSMEFPRQKYWSGLPFPSPGDLPHPEIEPGSAALQVDSLPTEPPANYICIDSFSKKGHLHSFKEQHTDMTSGGRHLTYYIRIDHSLFSSLTSWWAFVVSGLRRLVTARSEYPQILAQTHALFSPGCRTRGSFLYLVTQDML